MSLFDVANEMDREVAIREKAYPKWAEAGRYPQAVLETQLSLMQQGAKTVRWLAKHAEFVKWAIAHRDQITTAMAYLEKMKATPEVQAVLEAWPDAEIVPPQD